MSSEAKCRSCGAPVVWLVVDGKPHPCDPPLMTMIEETQASNGGMGKPQGRTVRVRASHFSTCPDAKSWRKPK